MALEHDLARCQSRFGPRGELPAEVPNDDDQRFGQADTGGVAVMAPLQARWEIDPTAEAVHDTRHGIATTLASWHVAEDLRQRALLVYAELATNALLHGDGKPFVAYITLGDEELTVDVTDGDFRIGRVRGPRRAGWDAETGRGLLLVSALAVEWGTYPTPNGKGVWAIVPAQAKREEQPLSWMLGAAAS